MTIKTALKCDTIGNDDNHMIKYRILGLLFFSSLSAINVAKYDDGKQNSKEEKLVRKKPQNEPNISAIHMHCTQMLK